MKKSILLFFAITVFTYHAMASWQAPVTNYFQKEYNAGTQSWQIKQQHNGWIYFANNYGLLEYDGNGWQTYGIWNSTVIRSLEIDNNGAIYVGGANEYGKFIANKFGALTYTPLSQNVPERYKNFGEVWNLHALNGDLYVQTRNYLFHHKANGQLVVIEPKSRIFCSAKIRDGIFVATTDGIYLLNGNQLNGLRGSEQLRGREIRGMEPYGDKGVLIGTDFDGLFLFDGDAIKRFPTQADAFIRSNQLYTFTVSRYHIAFGTVLNGVVVTDLNGKNCRYINSENGLQNNTILSMQFDDNNNLWLGLDQGIDRISIDSPIAQLYGHINSRGSGYTSLLKDGKLYLGTNQGVYYDNYPLNPAKRLTELGLVQGSLGQVWSLDTIGSTAFCCHNRGLFVLNNNYLTPLNTNEGFWRVRSLSARKDFGIAGSYNGLYLLSKTNGQWRIVHKIKGFNVTSRIFEIDTNDRIWIISNKGIECLTLNRDMTCCSAKTMIPFSGQRDDFFAISKIDDQIIVSSKRKCQITDANNNLVDSVSFFDQLLDGQALYSVIEKDDKHNLWYIHGNTLKMRPFDKKTGKYKSSIKIWNTPGLLIGGFEHLHIINNHEVICGSVSGFTLGNLNNAIRSQQQAQRPIIIRRIIATTNQDSVLYGESYPTIDNTPDIPYAQNSLRFEIGGAFNPNDVKEYAYKLSPIETDFSAWSQSNRKEYTNLKEGDYTLSVRMRTETSDEIKETAFNFVILPPWYRSWWANLIWAILFGFAIFTIYNYFQRKIEHDKRKLALQKDSEMRKKEQHFQEEAYQREKEILKLRNEHIEFELKSKSQELANVMLHHLNKNEILTDIKHDLKKISTDLQAKDAGNAMRKIILLQGKLTRNIEQEIDWKQFEENFDIVHDRFLRKLSERYSWLNKNERKLCVYIHMGLLTKEIAPLMNLSIRGVEMLRYRMRKKMELERAEDLEGFFQTLSHDDYTTITDDEANNQESNDPLTLQ